MINPSSSQGNTNNDSKNHDFLEQFFKDNNLFSENKLQKPEISDKNEKTEVLSKSEAVEPKKPIKQLTKQYIKLSSSQKDINLKNLFETIEREKNTHKKKVKREIEKHTSGEVSDEIYENFPEFPSQRKHISYIPTVEMIQLQTEFRMLFEDFLKILPMIEKSARLQEIEERYSRESRSDRDYFPELWENEGSIVFKEIQNKKIQQQQRQQEADEKIFIFEQKKRASEILALQEEEKFLQKQKKEEAHQKILLLKKKELLLKQEQEKRFEERARQRNKIREIKNSVSEFSRNIQSLAMHKTQNVFLAAQKKFSLQKDELFEKISEISAKKDEYIQRKSEEKKQREAKLLKLRALKRENKRQEEKTESRVLEGIKVTSMVAGLFLISMIGLNSGAILEVTEKYWDAEGYAEKQESTSRLVENSDDSVKNIFANIPALPVAGPISKTKNGFDTKMYLNISPPDTRIVIPKLGKNIPILTVENNARDQEDWDRLEKDIQDALHDGVVHYPGTANPGQHGNVFITGHSSYYPWDDGKYKDVFAALHDLEVGDEYFIFHKGKKYRYIITTRKIVSPSDVSVLEQDTSKKTSTLMTCTPIGSTARRLILQAEEAGVSY